MADYNSNMIKPVEGLQSITGLTPAKRRKERKRKQQLDQKKDEQQMDESFEQQDMDSNDNEWTEKRDELEHDSTGIDYCA